MRAARAIVPYIIAGRDVLSKGKPMTEKLPNLGGIATAIDKLKSAIEGDAKKVIEKVAAVHVKKDQVFAKAHAKVDAHIAAVDEADKALDDLDAMLGDNGGPPLKPGSTQSS